MFSCQWSTVYPHHPSLVPTCLFSFSLHLYSLQMSSQDAACLSHQYQPFRTILHTDGAEVFARIKQLYIWAQWSDLISWMDVNADHDFCGNKKASQMKKNNEHVCSSRAWNSPSCFFHSFSNQNCRLQIYTSERKYYKGNSWGLLYGMWPCVFLSLHGDNQSLKSTVVTHMEAHQTVTKV